MTAEKQRQQQLHQQTPRMPPHRGWAPRLHSSNSAAGTPSRLDVASPVPAAADGDAMPIGMALGSPSQAPPLSGSASRTGPPAGWQPQRSRTFTHTASSGSSTTPSEEQAPQQQQQQQSSTVTTPPKQQKSSSRVWGIFRAKSRSTKRTRANTTDVDTSRSETPSNNTPSTTSTTNTAVSSSGSQSSSTTANTTPVRGNSTPTTMRGNYQVSVTSSHGGKPSVSRSYTEPVLQSSTPSAHRHQHHHHHHHQQQQQQQQASHGNRPGLVARAESDRRPGLGEHPVRGGDAHAKRSGPMLDVHIPDITMERYSVMFGQVLKNKRQSKMQRLQEDEQVEQPQQEQESSQAKKPSSHPSWPQGQLEPHFPIVEEQQQQKKKHELPKSGTTLTRSSSALLARRQATLPELPLEKAEEVRAHATANKKPVNVHDHVALHRVEQQPTAADFAPPRRLGSPPQRRNSPQLHLFPPTPKPQPGSALGIPSPRLRSNTSPAGLPSPTFGPPKDHHHRPRPEAAPSAAVTTPRPHKRVAQSHPPPAGRSPASAPQRQPVVEETSAVCESPVDMHSTPPKDADNGSAPHPAAVVVSPPPSSSAVHSRRKMSQSSIMSERMTVVKPPVQVQVQVHDHDEAPAPAPAPVSEQKKTQEEEDEAARALKEAVEASITRQISVSREQRQLLGSLRGHNPRHGPEPSSSSDRKRDPARPRGLGFGSVPVAVGRHERLGDTKQLTPVMVHPGSEDGSSTSVHLHRRSERVILEGV